MPKNMFQNTTKIYVKSQEIEVNISSSVLCHTKQYNSRTNLYSPLTPTQQTSP